MGRPSTPASPWLGSSAETQTATDDDILLRPFNLCDIHTQTKWSELEDCDSAELTHTETQTLLSAFFMDNLNEMASRKILFKQGSLSEDAATDPMEIFN